MDARPSLERTPSSSGGSSKNGGDVEKQEMRIGAVPVGQVHGGEELKRQMHSRHVAMISIGGAIGTGLFVGTATALRNGGPAGLLLGYAVMGSIVFSVMTILGEMSSLLPIPGGMVTLAARFVNSPFGFCTGWWYWYDWALAGPAELSASAVLISFWDDKTNPAVYITVTGLVATLINLGGARAYGEMEFWFASIKVVTILGLIILGIVLMAGGGPSGEVIGGKYWENPGAFVEYLGIKGSLGHFLGFWSVLTQAAYSFIGSEIVALAAAEAKNPRKTIPSAIRKVWIRIIIFYVLGVWVVGMLVPSNDERLNLGTGTAASSPFVIAITDSGIKALPSIINAALLTSAWSAASSDLYTSSRALYGLALQGNAPRVFARTNSWGLPWPALVVNVAFLFLAYMAAGAAQAGKVFGWFSNMTSVCGLITWGAICVTYIRFYHGAKAQGFDRSTIPYRAPLQPYLTYFALVMICLILFFSKFAVFVNGHWDTADFITSYLPIILLPVVYVATYAWKRFGRKLPRQAYATVPLAELDFVSGSRSEDDLEEEEQQKSQSKVGKFFDAIL
ncbi:hypothetical protein JCM6882_007315 [Rhodosporidiobolus microsporus]